MSDLVKLDRIGALAVPPMPDLLMARRVIHASLELQRVFDDACTEGWDVERLVGAIEQGFARVLGRKLGDDTARYLAEEFAARDKTQALLVSAETGLAVAQVPPDAFYQPAPVAREGTQKLATPCMRLQPEVEAAIIQHHHWQGHENRLASTLQARARSTELQKQQGDARLRISTRSGRKGLAAQLLEELPALLHDHRGASGRLLKLCHVGVSVPDSHCVVLDVMLFSQVTLAIADALSHNFRHDALGSARERIRAAWTRSLAKAIASQAHARPAASVDVCSELGDGLLIAEPNTIKSVHHRDKLVVADIPAVLLRGDAYLTVGAGPYLEAYESEGRFNLDASVEVSLYLDPCSLEALMFTNVAESGASAELLR